MRELVVGYWHNTEPPLNGYGEVSYCQAMQDTPTHPLPVAEEPEPG